MRDQYSHVTRVRKIHAEPSTSDTKHGLDFEIEGSVAVMEQCLYRELDTVPSIINFYSWYNVTYSLVVKRLCLYFHRKEVRVNLGRRKTTA